MYKYGQTKITFAGHSDYSSCSCYYFILDYKHRRNFVLLFDSVTGLCEALEATADVQELWEELGLVLGLDRAVLSAISRDHPAILHRHYEIMKHWIKNGEASWEKLVDALRSPLLNEIQVSKDIVEKYLGIL